MGSGGTAGSAGPVFEALVDVDLGGIARCGRWEAFWAKETWW